MRLSSTGLLRWVYKLLCWGDDALGKSFAILIQLGAILAVLSIYFGRLWALTKAMFTEWAAARFIIGVLIAFVSLASSFVLNDFSVLYVAEHSNSSLPVAYRIAGVWGGHEGSLLLGALMRVVWAGAGAGLRRALPAIPGCLLARAPLLAALELVASDTLILLGDYGDRGPDSR